MSENEGSEEEKERVKSEERRRVESTNLELARKKKITFFLANAIGVLASLLSGLLSNVAFGQLDSLRRIGESGFTFVSQLHWLILFTSAIVAYQTLSLLVEWRSGNELLRAVLRIPVWTELRNFGNQPIFKISYYGIVVIPLLVWFVSENPMRMEYLKAVSVPLNLKITFFASFFLSLALISFVVGCPKEFARKSPDLLASKNVNLLLANSDRSVVNIAQEEPDYTDEELDKSKLILRYVCWSFYSLGLAYSTVLLFRSARLVLVS